MGGWNAADKGGGLPQGTRPVAERKLCGTGQTLPFCAGLFFLFLNSTNGPEHNLDLNFGYRSGKKLFPGLGKSWGLRRRRDSEVCLQ